MSADVVLKTTTILKEMRIAQLSSSNERTLELHLFRKGLQAITSYDIFAFKSKRQSCPWLDAYCSEKTRQRMQRVLLHRKALLMHNFRRRRGSKHIANLFTNMLKR